MANWLKSVSVADLHEHKVGMADYNQLCSINSKCERLSSTKEAVNFLTQMTLVHFDYVIGTRSQPFRLLVTRNRFGVEKSS